MSDMVVNSEYEYLLEETKRLQGDLAALIMECDELKHHSGIDIFITIDNLMHL